MNTIQLERLEKTILEHINEIIKFEVSDPRLQMVTITAVKLSNELSHAKVYYSAVNDKQLKNAFAAFESAKGFIRRELSQRIERYKTPALVFVIDDTINQGKKIESIIKDINSKK